MTLAKRSLLNVLQKHTPRLMAIPGVVGTAEGLAGGKPCILIWIAACTAELERRLPRRLEGYPVRLEVTGEIRRRRSLVSKMNSPP